MAKIVVFGGSRGTGLACVEEALARGHTVRMFARSAGRVSLVHDRLETFDGDALCKEDVDRALAGCDAAVQALGVPLDLKLLTGPITLFSEATRILVPAMEAAGIRRLVALTGFGAGDSYPAIAALQKPGFKLVFGRAYDDKTRQETLVKSSSLDWTFVRPGVLTNCPATGKYKVLTDRDTWQNGFVSRANVAHFILESVERDSWIGQGPVLIERGLLFFNRHK